MSSTSLRLSLSTASLYYFPLRQIFAVARQSGLDGIELVISPEVVLRQVGYLRALCEEYQLPILSLHQPMMPMPGWPKSWRALPRMIDIGRELGTSLLVVHPPKILSWDEEEGWSYVETLRVCQKQARSFSAMVTVENGAVLKPGQDDRYVLSELEALLALVDRMDLGVTLDVAHVVNTPYSPAQALQILRGRVRNIHFSNVASLPWPLSLPGPSGYLEHHVMPDEGRLALGPFLTALVCNGYRDVLTFEINPLALRAWTPASAARRLKRAVAYVRDVLERSA